MLVKQEFSAANAPKMRAADIAYNAIESMIVKLELRPGSPVVEAELVEKTGLGRTPLREALMRMSSNGLIVQMPRRGLVISDIDASEYMNVIATRRVLEGLIAQQAAQLATAEQRKDMLLWADKMLIAAKCHDLGAYMAADQAFDTIVHEACGNPSAVQAVVPLVIQCRRFWYAYQHAGDVEEGARCHMLAAKAIAKGNVELAVKASHGLMDYLVTFASEVMGKK
ncbi:MAG: GntR family transcriptional regulator [Undibacterium curvum]|jgi:DNA-binding GntR family transcriptional regulator|uniref:GntR family transcriptional regulator n=1 Tax=Undibacterium curvum TaxID=2762294 RepID=A0ABR7A505_9BURK|nr:GntR family transcriptional regulator [Undibacterium curvum]MBC3931927.1 GntR family transcriptional regulator [Undibacterium curvum]